MFALSYQYLKIIYFVLSKFLVKVDLEIVVIFVRIYALLFIVLNYFTFLKKKCYQSHFCNELLKKFGKRKPDIHYL